MSLRNCEALSEEDVLATVAFMHRCLRLDPKNGASAEELLQDTWWQEVA
jgi:serine/threonine-protein kinase SRPK3